VATNDGRNEATSPETTTGVPVYQLIADTMESNIRSGNLPDGAVINETALAKIFGTSRVPAAAALRQLEENGLIHRLQARGFKVGSAKSTPRRIDLLEAGLVLPDGVESMISVRSHRARLYPHVEREISACLPYGKFLVNESALARAYGVSRTVAHEILVRLERLDIARLEGSRWYVGPMTLADVRERYEMRWLLEPVALESAARTLDPVQIAAARGKIARYTNAPARPEPSLIFEFEQDLHLDMVLRCANSEMRSAIYRCQLPLISTHYTFQTGKSVEELHRMAHEHMEVFDRLLAGSPEAAGKALEHHLRSAFDVLIHRYDQLRDADWEPPPYVSREASRGD
jgi:DNA-binding GntR family transcriptional regulator